VIARRTFLASAIGGLAAVSFAARAQKPKPLRVGILVSGYRSNPRLLDAFLRGLGDLGYAEHDNLTVVVRDVEGRQDRFPALATELVALAPDVILAPSTPAARAAMTATRTIPVLFIGDPDPVASGLVASLARPGGNVTGISNLGNEIFGKRVELLKQAVPGVRRVAYLWQRGAFPERTEEEMLKRTDAEARALDVQLVPAESAGPADLDRAFAALAAARVDALILHNPSPALFSARKRIAELAVARRLPSMGNVREFAIDGGLLSYGPDSAVSFLRAANFVGRIAKGAKAGDLAVERATVLELCVNLRTAAAIGVTLPTALLARADDVLR
jgi:putative ABC transport system substrate-binding protein